MDLIRRLIIHSYQNLEAQPDYSMTGYGPIGKKKMTSPFFMKTSKTKGFVAHSHVMIKICRSIKKVASSNATVLIFGESGTGKELAAKAIHWNSPRKEKPFIAINCGALPENLLESELFGRVKGAFTGAENKPGRFELADGGTLFLDEIGETSPLFQVKLLRVLQEGVVQRVGDTKNIHVDVRVVAATNRDLSAGVKEGWFREDLFYRLNVIPITLPPLRNRREDIPHLMDHFLSKYAGGFGEDMITEPCRNMLLQHDYPGNIRELDNIIQRMVALSHGFPIKSADLPDELQDDALPAMDQALDSARVKSQVLNRALKNASTYTTKGDKTIWHKGLRHVTVKEIHAFLQERDDGWFSRKTFAAFLENSSRRDGGKYKTAGVYLNILKENKICVHNGKKANRSAYKLSDKFLA